MKEEKTPKNCYKCKSTNLKHKENLITLGNRFTEINVIECQKCGETYSTMNETEKARKALNPTIFNRIRSWFESSTKPSKKTHIFKDRIL